MEGGGGVEGGRKDVAAIVQWGGDDRMADRHLHQEINKLQSM